MKDYTKTFEALHNMKVPAFNPNYSQEAVDKSNEFHTKLRNYENSLPLTLSDDEENALVNREYIRLACEMQMYGWRFVNGNPTHNTVKGIENIEKYWNNKEE